MQDAVKSEHNCAVNSLIAIQKELSSHLPFYETTMNLDAHLHI